MILLGCLRPVENERIIILKPGDPAQIIETKKVQTKLLKNEHIIKDQDITAWVTMPPEHWEVVQKDVERAIVDQAALESLYKQNVITREQFKKAYSEAYDELMKKVKDAKGTPPK